MKIAKALICIFTIFLGVLLLPSCSTVMRLPPDGKNMVPVYLIKYSTWGHHSLGFYEDGIFTEYTYGDWRLFALNQRDPWTAWKNMTFFTQGALGKKEVKISSGEVICDYFVGCEAAVIFQAPQDKVEELKSFLKDHYHKGIETEVLNEKEGVFFVKYDKPYWVFHNCNHELVDWLESLGAETSGRVFYEPDLIEAMVPRQKIVRLMP